MAKSRVLTHKPGREIVYFEDDSRDEAARNRLSFLRVEYGDDIPASFLANWENVSLYHPRADVESAFALVLDPAEGAFDVRNKLNHLTGKDWVKFTSSWFVFNALPSDLKEERAISQDMATHPATYSPTMIESFIRFFTKSGQTVLDPFAGIGSTVVAAQRNERIGIGIELNPKYADLASKRIKDGKSRIYNYDSTKLSELDLPEIDFSISSPPYWDVLNRSTKDFRSTRESANLDSKYSDAQDDLGNIADYETFLDLLTTVYEQVRQAMRPGGYLVVIIKNVKKDGVFYPLAWDLARRMSVHWRLKDEKIWIQDKVGLAPYGYPHSWTSNIIHHYCLIFQKATG